MKKKTSKKKSSKSKYEFPIPKDDIAALIKRRRLQILIHSCLYYEMDVFVVSDHVFDKWCVELASLLKKYPKKYSDRFDSDFKGFTGETGMHLPHRDPWVYATAKMLLNQFDLK